MELLASQSIRPPEGFRGGEGNSSALQLYSSGETRTILSPFFLPGWPVLVLHWKSVRSNTALQGLSMDVSNKKRKVLHFHGARTWGLCPLFPPQGALTAVMLVSTACISPVARSVRKHV